LREEDAVSTLARIAAGELERCVLPWVVLMRGAGRSDIIEEWRRLAVQEPDERLRGEYGALLLVLSELSRHGAAWERGLEDWNVERSRHVMEWQAKGRAEGRAEGERRALLLVLQSRFQAPLPSDLASAIAELGDADELARWIRAASTAESISAFRSAVGR
jgi:hypothetical protein